MPISGKEMLKMYQAKGWKILRYKGSHVIVGKGHLRETIVVHGNRDLSTGLEKKLLKTLAEN